jgi:hypothetical protein
LKTVSNLVIESMEEKIKYNNEIHFINNEIVFSNPLLIDSFKLFLKKEHNISPYNYIEIIKEIETEIQKKKIDIEKYDDFEKLEGICEKFILEKGIEQVNLPHHLTEKVLLNLESKNTPLLFNEMQKVKQQCKRDLILDSVI